MHPCVARIPASAHRSLSGARCSFVAASGSRPTPGAPRMRTPRTRTECALEEPSPRSIRPLTPLSHPGHHRIGSSRSAACPASLVRFRAVAIPSLTRSARTFRRCTGEGTPPKGPRRLPSCLRPRFVTLVSQLRAASPPSNVILIESVRQPAHLFAFYPPPLASAKRRFPSG